MRTRRLRVLAIVNLVVFLNQLFFPTFSWALTGGPSQPEVHGFEPVGTNQMVDLFSGDFTYNIPLMDVGGYPVNMAYHSGTGMEDEASWVGLGWSLTPGSINRAMRGLPDDFKGEKIVTEHSMLGNNTIGVNASVAPEIIGMNVNLTPNIGVYENSYKGVGTTASVSASLPLRAANVNASLGVDSKAGADLNMGVSYDLLANYSEVDKETGKRKNISTLGLTPSFNMSLNSQEGLKNMSFGLGASASLMNDQYERAEVSRFNGSSNIPVNYQTYSPGAGVSMYNSNLAFDFATGVELFGTHVQVEVSAYKSKQWIADTKQEHQAYGYLYADDAENREGEVLMDYNREADYPFTEGMPNIQLSQMTYDVYNVSGQGAAGMFRPYRNDMPIVGDVETFNRTDADHSLSLELGSGQTARYGGNYTYAGSDFTNGYWDGTKGNTLANVAGYTKKGAYDKYYENVYLMNGGEMTPIDESIFEGRGGYDAVRVGYELNGNDNFETTDQFHRDNGTSFTIDMADDLNQRDYKRKPRSNSIVWRTNEEANNYGFRKNNESYSDTKTNDTYRVDKAKTKAPKYSGSLYDTTNRKRHHIGEVLITRPDGMRYVYGIPAYNKKTVDVGFSIDDRIIEDCADSGLVSYDAEDASVLNTKGQDHYFKKTTTPAHAHSYLLSAVLSPDYVDVTGDGVTADDYGTAVRLNYKQQVENYGWRAPYAQDKARFNEGLQHIDHDAKASYSYGVKEIWYLHSIETKTHLAEFYTSARNDGLGVQNERGVMDSEASQRLHRLDSILLFNKMDRIDDIDWLDRGKNTDEPIKKVYLSYDYSLCKGVPNQVSSGAGKLTLKSIRFAYGRSKKAMLSPYEFSYDHNPDYNMNNVDRWGAYKPNDCDYPNRNFPYTPQGAGQADTNASAWHLTDIKLPSGGTIEVSYEADDYAFVMNKEAMQMTPVAGVGRSKSFNPTLHGSNNQLYSGDSLKQYYVYFKLSQSVADAEELKNLYMPTDSVLSYKFTTYIKAKSEPELMDGYAQIADMGLVPGKPGYAYVQLKPEKIKPRKKAIKTNPIALNACKFINNSMSEKIYDKPPLAGTDEEQIEALLGYYGDITSLFTGKYSRMLYDGFAQYCIPEQSMIRLKSPTGTKKGGGSRVRKVGMKDQWEAHTTAGRSVDYGMVYEYKLANPDSLNSPVDSISSGVASYEPGIGADENPFKVPLYYHIHKNPDLKFLGGEDRYFEGPLGESFYPSASVGYSSVAVKSLATQQGKGAGTGYSVNEFYTAKDFPVKVAFTELKHKKERITRGKSFITGVVDDRLVASQGYIIRLNDMHGKQKAMWSYNNSGNRLSGSQYVYKSNGDELDNEVQTLNATGDVKTQIIGQTDDIVLDTRRIANHHWTGSYNGNFDLFTVGLIPLPFPTMYDKYTSSANSLKSVSTTKVIQQYGILESVTAYDEQSQVSTTNLLWDEGTGDVLLTRTENEYNDPLFNMKYPAYYAYDGMGHAYENVGLVFDDVLVEEGVLTLGTGVDASQYFVKGDVLSMFQTLSKYNADTTAYNRTTEAWVKGIKDNKVFLVNRNGFEIDGSFDQLKIIESGRTNQLGDAIASITTQQAFNLDTDSLEFPDSVLQAGITEFSEEWATFCDETPVKVCELDTNVAHPFMRTLNKLVSDGWFSQIETDATTIYDYDETWPFKNTKFSQQANRYTGYMQCSTNNCTTSVYTDTVYQYVGKHVSGITQSIINVGYLPKAHFRTYDWYKVVNTRIRRKAIIGCCETDSAFNNVAKFRGGPTTKDIHTIHFAMGIKTGVNGLGEDSSCQVFLTDITKYLSNNSLGFSAISSVDNIRLDPSYDNDHSFLMDVTINGTTTVTFSGSIGECYDLRKCRYECEMLEEQVINPYQTTVRGIWRPINNYVYHTRRSQTLTASNSTENTNLRKDGAFDYSPYWQFKSSDSLMEKATSISHKWVSPATVKHYSPPGNELEIEDALGRPSSEIYGYDRKVVSAVANNAAHNNIAFDGFEDYDYPYYTNCRKEPHWALHEGYVSQFPTSTLSTYPEVGYIPKDEMVAVVSFDTSHTGRASLYVPTGDSLKTVNTLKNNDTTTYNRFELETFKLEPELCIGKFAPEAGQRFIVSAWVQQRNDAAVYYPSNYDSAHLLIRCNGPDTKTRLYAEGPIIDGWQRIYGEFTIPADGATSITVSAVAGNFTGEAAYFDDVRIQPFNSQMKSYVYDPITLRMIAELDENNFATFYEYDHEGRLVRVKKETAQGIVTLQESRYGIPKNND